MPIAIKSFNPLQIFRRTYQTSAPRIKLNPSPTTRRTKSASAILVLPAAKKSKSLAARYAQAGFAKPISLAMAEPMEPANKKNAHMDVHILTAALKKGKPKAILETARQTSTHPFLADWKTPHNCNYKETFFVAFGTEVQAMDDGELLSVYNNLNNKKMQKLRGGLKHVADEGLGKEIPQKTGVSLEMLATSEQLETANRLVVAELSSRGTDLPSTAFEPPPALVNWSGENKEAQKTLLHFGRYLGGRVVAHEGQAPRAMKMALERNFSKLAFESQTRKIEGDGKEGGVTMADANDPNSPELNVSNIYLTDFRRSEKTFISPLGKSHMNNHPSFENATRQQISNHLTNFCSGTKREKELVGIPVHQAQSNNQTRRVQALLTQQALAALYDLQARAELGGPFRLKAEPKGKPRKPYLLGTVAANMEIKRLRNGDVEVLLTQILRPSAYLQEYGANRTTFKQGIDSKRSIILAQVKIRVPREINAAPVIENFTYESHLASKEGGG